MSMQWVSYKGKRILSLDYTEMDEASMLKQVEAYHRLLATETDVRQLTNFADATVPKSVLERAKQLATENPDSRNAKIALIGVNKHQKAYVFTYNFYTKGKAQLFGSKEEAMEWLASD